MVKRTPKPDDEYKTKTHKQIMFLKLLFALISTHLVFHPNSAISREPTAREIVVYNIALGKCLFYEGYYTAEDVTKNAIKILNEDGISTERVRIILQDKEIEEAVNNTIKDIGGCKKIGEDYDAKLQKLKKNNKNLR